MKKEFIHTISAFALVFILSSCSNEFIFNNITQLNYGTSFGMCVGFCKHDVSIKSKSATFNCYSFYPTNQVITKNDSISVSVLDSVCSFNTASFFGLPETIGCPDCADGGAEWLEIQLVDGRKHKVTFEYYKQPESIQSQITKLREILTKNECK